MARPGHPGAHLAPHGHPRVTPPFPSPLARSAGASSGPLLTKRDRGGPAAGPATGWRFRRAESQARGRTARRPRDRRGARANSSGAGTSRWRPPGREQPPSRSPGPFSSEPGSAPRQFFDHLAGAGRDAFDLFSVHLYGDPASVPRYLDTARQFMRAHGYLKPVIAGEHAGPQPFEFPDAMAVMQQVFTAAFTEAPPPQSTGELAAQAGQDTPERRAMSTLYAQMDDLPPTLQMFLAWLPGRTGGQAEPHGLPPPPPSPTCSARPRQPRAGTARYACRCPSPPPSSPNSLPERAEHLTLTRDQRRGDPFGDHCWLPPWVDDVAGLQSRPWRRPTGPEAPPGAGRWRHRPLSPAPARRHHAPPVPRRDFPAAWLDNGVGRCSAHSPAVRRI